VHLELTTCFKLLERTQGARDNAGVDGVHGGHGRSSGRGEGSVARVEEGNRESYGGGRPGSDAWGCREAGGGTGLQQRQVAARGGSGRRPGGVARRGQANTDRGSGGAGLRRHVAQPRAARRRRGRCTWPVERRRRRIGQRSRGGRGKVDEGGPGCKCQKG
jgi:hypothetical protein